MLINNHLRCFAHGACFRVDTGDIEDHPGHGHLPSKSRFSLIVIKYDWLEYNVEIVDDQVILVATKGELEKLERTKIPEDLQIEEKPIVAIIGAGAGKYFILRY